MKISKFKALTIATTVIGSASLASIAGITAVAVLNNQSSEENQDYSKNGSGDIVNISESDIKKAFINKKTTDRNQKVFTALNQIKSIYDLWSLYSRPDIIPNNVSIALDNVTTTSQTPDQTLGLEVKITVNGNMPATFVIYGFSPYTAEDYKQIFEAANPSGKFTKDGKYFPYLDWNDLSKDSSNPNYFPNYFKPVVPVELSANNIIVKPDWFNLSPGNVVNYHYVLNSQDNKVSVKASVPVSAYYEYQYPINTDAYKPVSKNWKPGNFDFIQANLPENYSRADFDAFIWKHWNGSTLVDAMNAYRYWYLFDQTNLTSKLESYVLNSDFSNSDSSKFPIGFIIRGNGANKNISLNPTYNASTNLNGNKSYLKLNWQIPNFKGNELTDVLLAYKLHGWKGTFNIDAALNIAFDSKKPTSLNKDGLVELPVTTTTNILFRNSLYKDFIYMNSKVVKESNWTVLDALYYYFKNNTDLNKSYLAPFFSQYSETLKKPV